MLNLLPDAQPGLVCRIIYSHHSLLFLNCLHMNEWLLFGGQQATGSEGKRQTPDRLALLVCACFITTPEGKSPFLFL